MQSIKLNQIHPSKTNPRKHFDAQALAELTESIKKHGVLQPILVREVRTSVGILHEIVAGERRYHAHGCRGGRDPGDREPPTRGLAPHGRGGRLPAVDEAVRLRHRG
jgi:hypothetical protein